MVRNKQCIVFWAIGITFKEQHIKNEWKSWPKAIHAPERTSDRGMHAVGPGPGSSESDGLSVDEGNEQQTVYGLNFLSRGRQTCYRKWKRLTQTL